MDMCLLLVPGKYYTTRGSKTIREVASSPPHAWFYSTILMQSQQQRSLGFKLTKISGACLAHSAEHMTLDLQGLSSSPTLGKEPTLKKTLKK